MRPDNTRSSVIMTCQLDKQLVKQQDLEGDLKASDLESQNPTHLDQQSQL